MSRGRKVHGHTKRKLRDKALRELPDKVQGSPKQPDKTLQHDLRRIWYAGAWRTISGAERRKKADNERMRRRLDTDPAFRARQSKLRRLRFLANIEKERMQKRHYYLNNREKLNAKRDEWRRKNKERQLANQRKNYNLKREQRLASIYARRDQRNPTRVLRKLTRDLRIGELGYSDFVKKFRKQVDAINGGDGK